MLKSEFDIISDGCDELKLIINPEQIEQLLMYKELLIKWNKTFSLTAITNEIDIINLHIMDGLTIVPEFSIANNILDVGSGMGIPAIILAIMYPDKKVYALDSNHKKAAFLLQVKIQLKLANLFVINKRVESYELFEGFSVITSRAFSDLKLFTNLTEHLLSENGFYLAMKSISGVEEARLVENDYVVDVISLKIPNIDANRFLIKLTKR